MNIAGSLASTQAHAAAARLSDAYTNRWFLDPIYRGAYPADGRAHLERLAGPFAFVREGDLDAIAQPIDFLGINYDHRRVIEADPDGGDLGWKVHDRTPGVPTIPTAGVLRAEHGVERGDPGAVLAELPVEVTVAADLVAPGDKRGLEHVALWRRAGLELARARELRPCTYQGGPGVFQSEDG